MDATKTADGSGEATGSDPTPRILIIGAGSRGNAYARAICQNYLLGRVVAVAEPTQTRRDRFGRRYIWGDDVPSDGDAFAGWREYITWERARREKAAKGGEAVPDGVDGVFVCTLDETHREIVTALAPLRLHVMCEKPLATSLADCLTIYRSFVPQRPGADAPAVIFGVGHVLRYSPHNMLLRKLLLEERAIGEIVSVEHTEPVGWWHFAHSYVRGNWRRESTSAPSLMTKSCHDIDFLLWLLCAPAPGLRSTPHQPSSVSSSGSLVYFRRRSKPPSAGSATNCLSCEAEPDCMYSAKKIYHGQLLGTNTDWPVKTVLPEIEDCLDDGGLKAAETALLNRLAENYDEETPEDVRLQRPWYGRCVYEAGNDVCDDQSVTMTWGDDDDDEEPAGGAANGGVVANDAYIPTAPREHRNAKRATFHMVAFTERICERRTRVYGTEGEIETDSRTIRVHRFATGETRVLRAPQPSVGGHGGGDEGLARQFLRAIDAVKNGGCAVEDAQKLHIGCTLEDIVQSHAMVFAAEEARRGEQVIDWPEWWRAQVRDHVGIGRHAENGTAAES